MERVLLKQPLQHLLLTLLLHPLKLSLEVRTVFLVQWHIYASSLQLLIMFMMVFTLLALNSFIVTGCPSSTSTPSYAKCALNLGISDPVSCISYQCGGSNCDQCSSSTINSCLSCASGYDYYEDLSLCTRPDPPTTPVNPVIKPTQTSTSVLLKVYNAITKGSTTGFSAAVAGKIFSNIKYLDIGYSSDLQRALKEWKSSFVSVGLDLDPPQGLRDNAPELGVPPTFEKYDVSSDFLINFWEGIIVLPFMVALFGILRALEYLTKASKHKLLTPIKKA